MGSSNPRVTIRSNSKNSTCCTVCANYVTFNYINSVEQGKLIPSFDVIEKICQVLEIKASWLFDEEASPENIKTFNKENYITEISDKLFNNLKKHISSEIRNCLMKD